MGIASVQNPFTDRNMPYEQPFQPDAGDAEAVPIFVILIPICLVVVLCENIFQTGNQPW